MTQQMGNAVRHHAGLAAAGPGQDQKRSIDVFDRGALGGSQVFEQIVQGAQKR